MAIWMEVRCETRGDGRSGETRCWSDDNSGPAGMAADDQRSVLEVLREMQIEARRAGWKRTRDGWMCPACIKHAAMSDNKSPAAASA
ncbi:hypothetical protein [Janthinobacterium sp. CAN_S7]|uniref:hypothetical protein n=1 Tax=Janthinobacterium sp. CAN_S7 TaxID=3071704 RepID=UPI00319E0A45